MIRKLIYSIFFILLLQNTSVNAGTTGSEDLSKSNVQNQNTANECFENISRVMFKFNHALDGAIFKPVAQGYRSLPAPIRKGTGNAVDNLRSLLTLSNNILQGDFRRAGNTISRFAINTTIIIKTLAISPEITTWSAFFCPYSSDIRSVTKNVIG